MKILILGADGFIGHSLIRRILAETDWEVVGLDRNAGAIVALLGHPRLDFQQRDIRVCHDWVDEQVDACDVVLPLVAVARPIEYVNDPLAVFELVFEENLRVIRACHEHGTRVIVASTSEVYGMSTDASLDEQRSSLVLGSIAKQRWMYACSKQMLDRVVWGYGQRGMQFTIVRPFNWFGPGQDDIGSGANGSSRVVTQFLGHMLRNEPVRLVDGGRQRRCFTYIDDGVDALMRVLRNARGAASGRIINIGAPDNEVSIEELAWLLAEILSEYPEWQDLPRTLVLRAERGRDYYGPGYEDVQSRRPDIGLARSLLGWQPAVSLRSGLQRTVAHYVNQRLAA